MKHSKIKIQKVYLKAHQDKYFKRKAKKVNAKKNKIYIMCDSVCTVKSLKYIKKRQVTLNLCNMCHKI